MALRAQPAEAQRPAASATASGPAGKRSRRDSSCTARYLLAWRMAVAHDLLRRADVGLEEVAERVGYASASTFSTAFSRHVGQPPGRYSHAARPAREAPRRRSRA